MGRPNHGLVEDSFAPLRAEADKLTQAVAGLRQKFEDFASKLAGLGGGLGGGRTGRPGSFAKGADSPAAEADKTGAAMDRAAKSGNRFRDSLRDASGAASGLQRTLKSGGDLAKLFGFEEAGEKLESFSKGLGAVKDLVSGIVAAAPALLAMGTVAGPVLIGLGAIQEAIHATTGEMLSLPDAIGAVALGINAFVEKGVAGWRLAFNDFAAFVKVTFAAIGAAILDSIQKPLWEVGQGIYNLGRTLQTSSNPLLKALGDDLRGAGAAMSEFAAELDIGATRLREYARGARREATAANDEILKTTKARLAGIDEQINIIFNRPDGASLFREPLKALQEMKAELEKTLALLGKGGAEASAPAARSALSSSSGAGSMQAVGQQAGVEWSSGVEQALADARPELNQAVIEALGTDKNGKAINSFKDLISNVGRLFKENPLQFVFTALGLAGGGGMGGGLGFADGGRVPGSGGAPSFAHLFAQGFARGGRPSWLPASDTVAAWLTPGEFVEPLSAVRKYGVGFMESVRSLSFPADVAHAFAGGIHVPAPVSTPAPRGYASGGAVAGGASGGGMPTVLPVLVADEASGEQFYSGSRNALLKFLHEHGVAFNR
jgi:hypothetical protein